MERQSRRTFSEALCSAELFGEGAAGGHQRREPAAPGRAPGAGAAGTARRRFFQPAVLGAEWRGEKERNNTKGNSHIL